MLIYYLHDNHKIVDGVPSISYSLLYKEAIIKMIFLKSLSFIKKCIYTCILFYTLNLFNKLTNFLIKTKKKQIYLLNEKKTIVVHKEDSLFCKIMRKLKFFNLNTLTAATGNISLEYQISWQLILLYK